MLDIYAEYANTWMFDIYTEYANKWMFDIYTEYANKWMFQFNELKSCVVQVSIFSVTPDFDWTISGINSSCG